jgi:hypothetical protein
LRPIPSILQVDPSEFHWLAPTIPPELSWDSTGEISRKLGRGRSLFKKALEQHLTKDECLEVEKTLESEPAAALGMEMGVEELPGLIKNNPFLAVALLVKLSNFPIVAVYL